MQTINRSAIVLLPRQPILDWLNYVDPNGPSLKLDEIRDDNAIYLAPEFEDNRQAMRWLERNCQMIFEEKLCGWITDHAAWPEKLTWKLFQEWFDISIHSMVVDLDGGVLEHDG